MEGESNSHLLRGLNPAQRQAVCHVDGPLLILAGPGSGKTRVITHRMAYLIDRGVSSHRIVAMTFTNKAAEEMKSRLEGLSPGHHCWLGTFHKFCARLLRYRAPLVGLSENFTIYDMSDARKVIRQAIESEEIDVRHYSPDRIAQEISTLKSRGVTAQVFRGRPGNALDAILERVYPKYQQLLRLANAVDFDDLLLHSVELLGNSPELRRELDERYQYMMVDEYQDTNRVQYQLIRLLNHDFRNIAVTGDPDQSIYSWRGANIQNILGFEKDYPMTRVVRLEQNYRSTRAILRVADQLIANNQIRKHKVLTSDNEEGEKVVSVAFRTSQVEADDIAETIGFAIRSGQAGPGDFAILYRTNYLSRAIENALHLNGIPYQVVNGHEFFQRREIKDLVAYLHLLNNSSDNVAFERIVNVPPRKIGKVTVRRIREYALTNGLPLLEAARRCGVIETIGNAASKKVAKFVTLFDGLTEVRTEEVSTVLKTVLIATGYREWLTEDESEEGHERASNVDELVLAAEEFDAKHPDDGGLEAFLEQAALRSDTDVWDSESEFVSLMTLHAAKGLEFPRVMIVGLEDGILPHERSQGANEDIEEERRLLFVGITRAQHRLQLSRCLSRRRRGSEWPVIASRFLMELPRDEMETFEPPAASAYASVEDLDVNPWEESADFDDMVSIDINEDLLSPDLAVGNHDSGDGKVRECKPEYPRLMTGSQLAQQQEVAGTTRLHPDLFRLGMRVRHENYGAGEVVELSGQGKKRVAKVDFDDVGCKNFRLAHVNLQLTD